MSFASEKPTVAARPCADCGKRVQWIVSGINLGLFVLKGWFAVISQSRSLFVDALQSLANLVITVVVLATLRIAARGPDKRFPYGYGKVEFLASGLVNTLLMAVAVVFLVASFAELVSTDPGKPARLIAIAAALISILANQVAFRLGRCAGERLASPAMLANAAVSRADIGTSVVVIVAVAGSNLGIPDLDHIAAIGICIFVAKVTLGGAKSAVNRLMDAALPSEERRILRVIQDVLGVASVGGVTARLAGRSLWVDLKLLVPADWALSRGLRMVRQIKTVLHTNISNLSEVSVELLPVHRPNESGNQEPCGSDTAKRP